MLMQQITVAAAIAYVKAIEAEWYGGCEVIGHSMARESEIGFPAYDVFTAENRWTVWLERDGSIYGEC